MRTSSRGIRLSAVSTGLLMFGLALLVVSAVGPQVSINGVQVGPGVSWWQRAIVAAVGVLAISWAIAASREPTAGLLAYGGFLGAPPSMPARLVERPGLSESIERAIAGGARVVAVTGTGGSGKSTLAARACVQPGLKRRFPDGVTWLEVGPRKDPVALLADLARRLGLSIERVAFTAIEQGRDLLAARLRGKRVLIALDNVWDREPLDAVVGLAPTCAVIFTTRTPGLSTLFNAAKVEVDELTRGQALELLSRWTGQVQDAAPDIAVTLCTRLGNLPLGVAMAGAMVANGRSMSSVIALIEHDLTRIRADLDPQYEHPTLFAAIEAGISDLPEASRKRYDRLAVFAGRGPFPADATVALWQPDLSQDQAEELLSELCGRSLLMAEGDGLYAAHDLQFEVLKHRIGEQQLADAHRRLLEEYRRRYPTGWSLSAGDHYLANTLAGHLYDAGRDDELRMLLTSADWIQARLTHGQMAELLADYRYASDMLTIQVMRALRLSAPVLASNAGQVQGQLAGRLLGHPDPIVATWARSLTDGSADSPWLAPLSPALTATTTGLKQSLAGHAGPVYSVGITPDGSMAVSGGQDGSVRVWDLAAGSQRACLAGHTAPAMSVAITADGTTAVSGGDEGSVRVWDLTTNRLRTSLGGHSTRVRGVAISADGVTAVTAAHDGSARVWDLVNGRSRGALAGHTGSISSVALTADATFGFTSAHDKSVRIWDIGTLRQRSELAGHNGVILSVAVTNNGSRVVGGGLDGSVWVWDTASSQPPRKLAGHRGWVRSVSISRDGGTVVTGGADGIVRAWDLATGRQTVALVGHSSDVLAVAVSQSGADAVSGGADGVVRVWDLAASRIQALPDRPVGQILAVAVTPDGHTALSGGDDDHGLRVWDLATGQVRAKLTGHAGRVLALAVSSDGSTAISGGDDDHDLRVWDLATGEVRATLTGHAGRVLAVLITPDSGMAISGSSDHTVRLWNLATGRAQATLSGHLGWVRSVAITKDEFMVVSGGDDGYIHIWDLPSGRSRAIHASRTGRAIPVAVAPDGSMIVSGSPDGSLHLWDLASGQKHSTLLGHRAPISSVAIAPAGRTIVSGDSEGTIRVWDPARSAEIASWKGDNPIIMCTALPGDPLKIAVGQRRDQPYLLGLRD